MAFPLRGLRAPILRCYTEICHPIAGGTVELVSLQPGGVQPTACLKITGSGSTINSVRVEIAQRLKRNFPTLANVTWE